MVIVCFATTAVALQATDSLDTSAMILALSAHMATRGRPLLVQSDLQKSFLSANRILAHLAGEDRLDPDSPGHLQVEQQARVAQIALNTYLGQNNVPTKTPASFSPHLQAIAERKMTVVKSIVSCKFSHHVETDNSFASHCTLVAEYVNSIPHSVDRSSNTFYSRQQLLVSFPHRPGSLDVDIASPLLHQFLSLIHI